MQTEGSEFVFPPVAQPQRVHVQETGESKTQTHLQPLTQKTQEPAQMGSIDNFDDEIQSDNIITSPRSLQACKNKGIRPIDLAKKSKQQIREMFFGRDLSDEALVMFEKHLERRRLDKIELVRMERQRLIQAMHGSSIMSRSRSVKPLNTAQSAFLPHKLNGNFESGQNSSRRDNLEPHTTTNASQQLLKKRLVGANTFEDGAASHAHTLSQGSFNGTTEFNRNNARENLMQKIRESEVQRLEKIKKQQKLEILGMVRAELENRKIDVTTKQKEFRIRQSIISRQKDFEKRRQEAEEAARKREEERVRRAEEELKKNEQEIAEKERAEQERIEKERQRELQRLAEAAKREEERRIKQEQARELIDQQSQEQTQKLREKLHKLEAQQEKFQRVEEDLRKMRQTQAQEREQQHKRKYNTVQEVKEALLEQQRQLQQKRHEKSENRRRLLDKVREDMIRKAREISEEKFQHIHETKEKLQKIEAERAQTLMQQLEEHARLARLQEQERLQHFRQKRQTEEKKEDQVRGKKEHLQQSTLQELKNRFDKKQETAQQKLERLQRERQRQIDLHASLSLLKQVTAEDNIQRLAAVNENRHQELLQRLQQQDERVRQIDEEKTQMMQEIKKFQMKITQQKDRIKQEFQKRMKTGNMGQIREIIKDFDLEISEDLLKYADLQTNGEESIFVENKEQQEAVGQDAQNN